LEVNTLSSIPVPDPAKVPAKELRALIKLADTKLAGDISAVTDQDIDERVSVLYGLTHDERLIIGFEGYHA
jgi:hypothetical protein